MLLPVLLTAWLIIFLINFLTQPFLHITHDLLVKFHLLSYFPFNSTILLIITIKLFILLFLFLLTTLVGMLGNFLFTKYLLICGEYFFQKIPLINKVYKACHDVVNGLFASPSKTFSQVVLVPFPCKENLSIGLVVKKEIKMDGAHNQEWVSVLIPATPNPLFGFILLVKKEELKAIDLSVDEAIKFVISCGLLPPTFGKR